MAYKAKSRVSIQNDLRWLQVNGHAFSNKAGWLTQNVMQYGKREVLDKLAQEGTQIFYKKWVFIPSNIGFDTMWSSSYLIPQVVVNHFNDINNGGSGLFRDGRFIQGDSGGEWTL
jgi:hypothetical protein